MEPIPIKSLRVLLERDGVIFKVAKVAFSQKDVSVYVMPYQYEGGHGFGGQMMIPGPGKSNSWNFTRQLTGEPVKVSIHESGRTHAQIGALMTEPVWGRGLFHDEVSHVATISCFSPVGLPEVVEPRGAPQADIVLRTGENDWTSVHVPLFVCPDIDTASNHIAYITLNRSDRERALYLAIGARVENAPSEQLGKGVLVFTGWGPGNDHRPLNGIYALSAPAEQDPRSIGQNRGDFVS